VSAVEPDGRGGWFIAGEFAAVGGVQCANLAHVYASGRVDRSWCPQPDGSDLPSMARAGNTLYVTGDFTRIGGAERQRLAALSVRTGRATPWQARGVNLLGLSGDLELAAGDGRVFLGSGERFIGGSNKRIVALDARSGRALKWDPRLENTCRPCYREICAIAVRGKSVYVAGSFSHVRGERRVGLAALDAVTARPSSWQANVDEGAVIPHQARAPDQCSEFTKWRLVPVGRTLYVGGPFERIHSLSRDGIAAVDVRTGRVERWKPRLPSSSFGVIGAFGANSSSVVIAYADTVADVDLVRISSVDRETGRKVRWTRDLPLTTEGGGVAGGRVLIFG